MGPPIFPQPASIPPEKYAEALRVHSGESHRYTATLLENITLVRQIKENLSFIDGIGEDLNVEILVTGSDGREEKGTFIPGKLNGNSRMTLADFEGISVPSKMDMLAVLSLYPHLEKIALYDPFSLSEAETTLQGLLEAHHQEVMALMKESLLDIGLFEKEMEVKSIHSPDPSGYFNDRNKRWPTRIIDSLSLTPSDAHLDQALRVKLTEEIFQNGKKMHEHEKDRLRDHRRVCTGFESDAMKLKPGMQRYSASVEVLQHFDLEQGVAYYDREERIGSFKFGPLRTVQMQISSEIIRLLKTKSKLSAIRIIRELPRNTEEKLWFLNGHRLISTPPQTIERLIENYHFFLQLYHQSEWLSAAYNQTEYRFGPTQEDRADVKDRLSDLVQDTAAMVVHV